MAVWDTYLYYLIKPDHEEPDLNIDPVWYPYEWFEILDHTIPKMWSFSHSAQSDENDLSLLWGYKEIVIDDEHEQGIMERNKKALEIFYRRKMEMDKEMEG
ncbi:MAG: GNAT family acetyltransferase [Paenibacillus sp.]|uniref:GNAT family acetyltransferase n=1 Tax=Paenibacillus sp. TaxID=58172 RepID=UPI003B7D66E8